MTAKPSSRTAQPVHRSPPRSERCARLQDKAIRRDSYSVLVIDDYVAFQQYVGSILRKNGFVVLSTSSGLDGLDMLGCKPGDIRVVLLDYTMPGLDGTKTLQHVRKLNPSIKVVAVTASIPQLVTADFREGVDAYIEKPILPQELIAIIDNLVGSKPQ